MRVSSWHQKLKRKVINPTGFVVCKISLFSAYDYKEVSRFSQYLWGMRMQRWTRVGIRRGNVSEIVKYRMHSERIRKIILSRRNVAEDYVASIVVITRSAVSKNISSSQVRQNTSPGNCLEVGNPLREAVDSWYIWRFSSTSLVNISR